MATEQHEQQYRGTWIPADIMRAWDSNVLSCQEVVFLALIDSLVHPVRGCTASNGYLATKMHVSTKTIERLLSKLKKLGLIIYLTKDKHFRKMETAWSSVKVATKQSLNSEGLNPSVLRDTHNTSYYSNKLSTSPRSRKATEPENHILPFFEDTSPKKTKEPTLADYEMADKLAKAVQEKAQVRRKFSRRSWATKFRQLQTEDKVPLARAQKTLEWFCANIRGEYVPQAFSADGFRKKYAAIEAAMKRATVADVEISPNAKKIAKALAGKHWPKGSDKQLEAAAQISLDNFSRFRGTFLETYQDILDCDNKKLISFAKHMKQVLPDPVQFVTAWLEDVHASVANWEAWKGDLVKRALKIDSPNFLAWGRGVATNYCAQAERFDMLMEYINAD